MRTLLCFVVLACAWPAAAAAQPDPDRPPGSPARPASPAESSPAPRAGAPPAAGSAPLRVGISPFVPFVFAGSESLRGFSIELWEELAGELDVEYSYVLADGVAEKLAQLRRGETDLAIGGITLTRERELHLDFTHPTMESGLSIMVRAGGTSELGLLSRLRLDRGDWTIILGFLALVVIAGHLMWLAERGRDAFNDRYVPGVFEGMYWAIVTASTVGYGDKAPVRWPGRVVAALVIVVALPMFALFTAELASSITVAEIESRIDGPEDLVRKRVGVVRGTTSAAWAVDQGLDIYQWDRIDEVYGALQDQVVDAVIYDAPNLHYHAQHAGRGEVQVVGGLFQPQNLGIAAAEGSPLRERINRALLDLVESGELQRLRVKWFGNAARQ